MIGSRSNYHDTRTTVNLTNGQYEGAYCFHVIRFAGYTRRERVIYYFCSTAAQRRWREKTKRKQTTYTARIRGWKINHRKRTVNINVRGARGHFFVEVKFGTGALRVRVLKTT